jgi:hypothetical protein
LINPFQTLIDRIRGETADLDQVVRRAGEVWLLARKESDEQAIYIDSVALNLHSLYSGLERLFELIARQVDRYLPEGANWHHDLLKQMANDVPDARPAVISEETADALDEFRRFRHLVRNVYTLHLDPNKMQPLLESLPVLWLKVRAELLAMADYLEQLSTSLDAND